MLILNLMLAMAVSFGTASEVEEPADVSKIKSHTDFKLLLPSGKPASDWKMEVKWPLSAQV
ncbi:hypothetical protein RJP21_20895 [Paenibacillus sp. VCA1]|uniref:hypothetical protein n=1 Tax=Paenibacillus sp. VCA1 TaxID=3039148 RepID=UPI002870E71E|nr:hypothetical protein [Paenibacillus sp. VCA1]MDR9856069.1 hypothetical protein [Paenibacillus sp. VCA1]